MNKILTYLIIVSMHLITANVFASSDVQNPKTIMNCYENSSNHENEWVVKSTIQNIMKLNTVYSELNYSKALKKLQELSVKSESKKLRYNAYIAINFLKYPDQLKWNLPDTYEELDDFLSNYEIKLDTPIAQSN